MKWRDVIDLQILQITSRLNYSHKNLLIGMHIRIGSEVIRGKRRFGKKNQVLVSQLVWSQTSSTHIVTWRVILTAGIIFLSGCEQNMASITRQPGMSGSKEYSGSVQYIGGYNGPYSADEDVFLQEKRRGNEEIPIPMGLEVFERVSKLVAHQVVSSDEG